MSSQLRIFYDQLRDQKPKAVAQTAKAKSAYDQARADEAVLDHEIEAARAALDLVLDGQLPKAKPVPAKAKALKVPQHLRELLQYLPAAGELAVADLRSQMGLSLSTVNTRLQKAMKLGLIERPTYGHYRLSQTGQAAKGGRLQAVQAVQG